MKENLQALESTRNGPVTYSPAPVAQGQNILTSIIDLESDGLKHLTQRGKGSSVTEANVSQSSSLPSVFTRAVRNNGVVVRERRSGEQSSCGPCGSDACLSSGTTRSGDREATSSF